MSSRKPPRPITRELLASLRPEATRYELPDPKCRGLYVRVNPSGEISWAFRYSTGGLTQRITLGRWPATSLEQARSRAGALRSQVDGGQDPALERERERAAATTLADLAERFEAEHMPRLKPRSVRVYEQLLRIHIVPKLGKVTVQGLTTAHVAKFHHDLRRTPRTANHALAVLQKMLGLAIRWGLRPDGVNPVKGQERYHETHRQRFLDPAEIARVAEALGRLERGGEISPLPAAAIRLMLLTGARKSEILALRWEDVGETGARLRDHKTISRGERRILLPPEAAAVLAGLPQHHLSPFVFAGRGRDGTIRGTLDHTWQTVRVEAGLEDVRLHDLRHTFASLGIASGLTLAKVGQLLGHSTPATTQRYTHLVEEAAQQAAAQATRQTAAAMRDRTS